MDAKEYQTTLRNITEQRKDLYRTLKNKFSPNIRTYYPGSGADPIPATNFNTNIVYGSLSDNGYLPWLKGKEEIPENLLYKKEIISNKEKLSKLKAIYANVLHSPFANNNFDVIILRGLDPIFYDKQLYQN